MKKKNSLKEVPFGTRFTWGKNEDGSTDFNTRIPTAMYLMEYVLYASRVDEWRPNVPFAATLRIDRLERGRSAARFWFENVDNGEQYPFFGQGLVEMLERVDMNHGVVSGTWIAVKRGANYGIELYEADDD